MDTSHAVCGQRLQHVNVRVAATKENEVLGQLKLSSTAVESAAAPALTLNLS